MTRKNKKTQKEKLTVLSHKELARRINRSIRIPYRNLALLTSSRNKYEPA